MVSFETVAICAAMAVGLLASFAQADGGSGPEYCFNYIEQGRWGEPACGSCAGKRQSPIELPLTPTECTQSTHLVVEHGVIPPGTLEVQVNGPLNIAVLKPDNYKVQWKNKTYKLINAHLHYLAEHTIKGSRPPMELHFVHAADDDSKLVIGQFIHTPETHNATFGHESEHLRRSGGMNYAEKQQYVFNQISTYARQQINTYGHGSPKGLVIQEPLDLGVIMDMSKGFYHYEGSLTRSPCTENVDWVVLHSTVYASISDIFTTQLSQVLAFPQAPFLNFNNRDVQPLNGRDIYNYCGSDSSKI